MLIVQKYGGTSVGSIERIKAVAERVVKTKMQGNHVVVIVSAMSGETDKLIGLANRVSQNPDGREMDLLLSSGERISAALTAIAINELGQIHVFHRQTGGDHHGWGPYKRKDREDHRRTGKARPLEKGLILLSQDFRG